MHAEVFTLHAEALTPRRDRKKVIMLMHAKEFEPFGRTMSHAVHEAAMSAYGRTMQVL